MVHPNEQCRCDNNSSLRFQIHGMHRLELVLSRRDQPQAIEIRNRLPLRFLINKELTTGEKTSVSVVGSPTLRPNFHHVTAKPSPTLNAQAPIDPQTPKEENEENKEEDIQLSKSLPQPDRSAPHFLHYFPQTRALFEHLTDRSGSLSLDESSRQGIQPMLSAPDGRPFISRKNEAGQTLADIAAAYGCEALYEDLNARNL
jgi:hypothetical protein